MNVNGVCGITLLGKECAKNKYKFCSDNKAFINLFNHLIK